MKQNIFFIILLLTILQISCAKQPKLKPDATAKEVFTTIELIGIMTMINYVDELVVEKTSIKDINQAYHAYLEELKSYLENGDIFPPLTMDTIKFKFLESLDQEAFDAIWRKDQFFVKSINYKNTVPDSLNNFEKFVFNSSGSYMDYLSQVGNQDSRYKEASEAIKIAGDMSPSVLSWLPAHHSEYDFTTFKDRLWAAAILLRIGDPIDKKVERYL